MTSVYALRKSNFIVISLKRVKQANLAQGADLSHADLVGVSPVPSSQALGLGDVSAG